MSGARLEDRRRHNFFILDNEVIDDYIELIPENRRADALAVYAVLARHANEHGVAWPGVAYIGRKIGRSRPTVIDAVKELGKLGLVGKEERADTPGGQATNIYTLPPVEKGRSEPSGVNTVNRGCKQDLQGGVNEIDTKKTQKEKDYEAKASKAKPTSETIIPLDKYTTDRMYTAFKEAGYPKWTQDEYGYHISRVQQIIAEDSPTDDELMRLPEEYVALYTNWNRKADAVLTLREMRVGARRANNVTQLRPVEPARPKKRVIS